MKLAPLLLVALVAAGCARPAAVPFPTQMPPPLDAIRDVAEWELWFNDTGSPSIAVDHNEDHKGSYSWTAGISIGVTEQHLTEIHWPELLARMRSNESAGPQPLHDGFEISLPMRPDSHALVVILTAPLAGGDVAIVAAADLDTRTWYRVNEDDAPLAPRAIADTREGHAFLEARGQLA